jgi:hypothetical protein
MTQAVTVLLVLLMSTMLVLPPGMDLELCFGNDGHVDFSLNSCQDGASSKAPAKERSPLYDTIHNDDCLHTALVCSTTQELIRTDGKVHVHRSELKKDTSKAPLLFSKSLADSAGTHLDSSVYSIPDEDFPSHHLVSIRTIVLLI